MKRPPYAAVPALLALFFLSGCAVLHGTISAFERPPSETPWVYVPALGDLAATDPEHARLLFDYAPVWVVAQGEARWNRIGSPTLRRTADVTRARIDTERPAVYAHARSDELDGRPLVHLIYRVHFDQFGFTPKTFYALHRNAGFLCVITLDEEGVPLFVTGVHTCGCYRALLPTQHVPTAALPEGWPADEVEVVGETLPAVVTAPLRADGRVVLHLATRSHRLVALSTSSATPPGRSLPLELRSKQELYRLPIEGYPGRTASFFYDGGFLEGHVRGAWSAIEGLTAGLVFLDPRLGMDKDFGSPEETGARFYTSLVPWRREASRLDRFEPLLALLGYRFSRP